MAGHKLCYLHPQVIEMRVNCTQTHRAGQLGDKFHSTTVVPQHKGCRDTIALADKQRGSGFEGCEKKNSLTRLELEGFKISTQSFLSSIRK